MASGLDLIRWLSKRHPLLSRLAMAYFGIGLICAIGWTFQGGLGTSYLLLMPIGWVTIAGWIVAWPGMFALIAWYR